MSEPAICQLCGEPMPEGEEMFNYHGYSGPCPNSPLVKVEHASPSPEESRNAAQKSSPSSSHPADEPSVEQIRIEIAESVKNMIRLAPYEDGPNEPASEAWLRGEERHNAALDAYAAAIERKAQHKYDWLRGVYEKEEAAHAEAVKRHICERADFQRQVAKLTADLAALTTRIQQFREQAKNDRDGSTLVSNRFQYRGRVEAYNAILAMLGESTPSDVSRQAIVNGLEFCPRCASGPRHVSATECQDCGYIWPEPSLRSLIEIIIVVAVMAIAIAASLAIWVGTR